MAFVKANTWQERGLQVQKVKDKCNNIIRSLQLKESDARVQGFVHVRQCCNTLAAVPIKLQQNAEIAENVPYLLSLLGLSITTDLYTMLSDLNKNAKAAFLATVQFALENSARRVLQALTPTSVPLKFRCIVERLATLSGIPSSDAKVELLMVLAYLRNTLHSNGIHCWPDATIVVADEPYIFRQYQRSPCGSWSHILYALVHSLSVYEEIYTSHKVTVVSSITIAQERGWPGP